MTFYEKVNNLCLERGISITSLALSLGFSKGTPSNWKKMKKPPRAHNVKAIADYFNVPVDYLLSDTTDTTDNKPQQINPLYDSNLLEKVKADTGKRILFDLLDDATEDDIRQVIAIVRALQKTKGGENP